ncbi:MAG: ABC transporter ATP-binding protein [Cyanobacteria bacterium J06621_8]
MFKYLLRVWYILEGSRKRLPVLLLVFVLSSVTEALGFGLIGPFLNLASNPDSLQDISLLRWAYLQSNLQTTSQFIPILGLAIAVVFCLKSFLYFLAQKYIANYSFNQRAKLTLRLLNSYLTAPYSFYLSKNSASIINNIVNETVWFTIGCMLPLLEGVANLTIIFILMLLLAQTDLRLLALILVVLLPTFLIFYQLRTKFQKWGRETVEANQETIRIINHSLGGLKETRIIGCEAHFKQQMEQQAQIMADALSRAHIFRRVPRIIIETSLILFIVAFISVSQLLFSQNVEDMISILAVFAIASMRIIPATSQLMQAMSQIQSKRFGVDQLYLDLKEIEKQQNIERILTAEKQQKDFPFQSLPDFVGALESRHSTSKGDLLEFKNGKVQTMKFNRKVELKNVTYSYPSTSEPAIDRISLDLIKGQSIAFIGKSGAGKTTLVDVILGLLQPEGGDIVVDDQSIYGNLRSWKNLIGYIPQSIFLMDETIEKNIAFGVPEHLIDRARIEHAIKAAQLEEFVEQMPQGVKTTVGERGLRLSGGQRQRIGIARALYHEREILVLDEATSALDNETEKLVSKAISSLAGTKTLIIIAHRLTTVEHCDRIYLLENGHIVKSGSYQEVVLDQMLA